MELILVYHNLQCIHLTKQQNQRYILYDQSTEEFFNSHIEETTAHELKVLSNEKREINKKQVAKINREIFRKNIRSLVYGKQCVVI